MARAAMEVRIEPRENARRRAEQSLLHSSGHGGSVPGGLAATARRLRAIAWALLDIADAIRELAAAVRARPVQAVRPVRRYG